MIEMPLQSNIRLRAAMRYVCKQTLAACSRPLVFENSLFRTQGDNPEPLVIVFNHKRERGLAL